MQLANVFGAAGYMLLIAAWALALAVILAITFELTSGGYPAIAPEPPSNESIPAQTPSPVIVVASYTVAGLFVVFSVGMLITMPYFVGKWSSTTVKTLMKICRVDMTLRQLVLVKGILVVFPLLILLILLIALRPEGIVVAGIFGMTVAAAILSMIMFLLQALLARRQKLPFAKVW